MRKSSILFATTSRFKQEEVGELCRSGKFVDADNIEKAIGDHFSFEFSAIKTDEPLEIDLSTMVHYKATSAYRSLQMPCIVEHAGIIFVKEKASGFPGGLTQPMWDSLGAEGFLARTQCCGERAIARAVFGYCDGMSVRTFVGETEGVVADVPRGARQFYWDTIFCPASGGGLTYAEISEGSGGLAAKMAISQSYLAMRNFLSYRARAGEGELFGG